MILMHDYLRTYLLTVFPNTSTDILTSNMDITNLKKMPPRVLARLIKLWTPWWTSENNLNVEVFGNISPEISLKKRCE